VTTSRGLIVATIHRMRVSGLVMTLIQSEVKKGSPLISGIGRIAKEMQS
jgi:hypothetical protein